MTSSDDRASHGCGAVGAALGRGGEAERDEWLVPAALPRAYYERPTVEVARDLLGAVLVYESPRGRVAGTIVETEAYIAPEDEACHAYRGVTPRNRVMFGPAGHAYVYRSYGIHAMINVVTEGEGIAAAVLIRAVEPVDGLEVMSVNRGLDLHTTSPKILTKGPGRLCRAMGIDTTLNSHDLTIAPLYILPVPRAVGTAAVVQTTRIGITRSVELPWRFYLRGNHCVSVRNRAAERASMETTAVPGEG